MEKFIVLIEGGDDFSSHLDTDDAIAVFEAESEDVVRSALTDATKEYICTALFDRDLWHGINLDLLYREIGEKKYLELKQKGTVELYKTTRGYYRLLEPEILSLDVWLKREAISLEIVTPAPGR